MARLDETIRHFVFLVVLVLITGVGSAGAQSLSIGKEVPNFTLVDHEGRQTSLSDFRGRGVIVSFLYTKCPFPDKCPMIGRKLAGLARLMDKLGREDSLQVLAITLDPATDKPEVLKAYAQGFDKDQESWRFLTGSEEQIARVAGAFGVLYWDEGGVIEHNLRTAFIDDKGVLRLLKTGADWRAGEFAAEIQKFLK